ncbi:MAG: uridine kinase [Acidobacteria bacterium]|nr:uridine kinase [Acidobacteriota bacterium]
MPLIIGLCGGTGSGKTTMADEILRQIGPDRALILHQDSYYRERSDLPLNARAQINFDHPDAFDWPLLMEHVRQLREGLAIDQPAYNFHTHNRMAETARINPQEIIIIEGILIFENGELRSMMDIKIFVDTDPDVRFIRRLQRDTRERGRSLESVIEQYMETVRPMHLEFVEPSKRYADIIFPEGGRNKIAIDVMISRINSLFQSTEQPR